MVLPAPLMGLGGLGPGSSDQHGIMTHVHGTGEIPSFPQDLSFGGCGGREMILDCLMWSH